MITPTQANPPKGSKVVEITEDLLRNRPAQDFIGWSIMCVDHETTVSGIEHDQEGLSFVHECGYRQLAVGALVWKRP